MKPLATLARLWRGGIRWASSAHFLAHAQILPASDVGPTVACSTALWLTKTRFWVEDEGYIPTLCTVSSNNTSECQTHSDDKIVQTWAKDLSRGISIRIKRVMQKHEPKMRTLSAKRKEAFFGRAEFSGTSNRLSHSCLTNGLYEFPLTICRQNEADKQTCDTIQALVYCPSLDFNSNRNKKRSLTQRQGRCAQNFFYADCTAQSSL